MIEILEKQRAYFRTGATLPVKFRIEALKKLKSVIVSRTEDIFAALKEDLGKSGTESYMSEIGMTLSEINYMINRLPELAREKGVPTPLSQFKARSYVKKCPYGCVLVMSPWNYPFMLTLDPVVDAVAAGNTVIAKPSAYSPATSKLLSEIISQAFAPEHVTAVLGGRAENAQLLDMPFDKIFFTGSVAVGKEVMRKAAERLIPVTLELGGKSPCIVDESAKIDIAARRIVFGKFLNCGQTCVAPDYIIAHKSIKNKLVEAIEREIVRQYGEYPLENADYGKIISKKHFDRIVSLIDENKVCFGGQTDEESLRISPTIMDNVTRDDAVMGEEIFGPILPVMTFEDLGSLIDDINSHPHPLALYMFSEDKEAAERVTEMCQFGGGCVNDTIIHLATTEMGFGGVGESGMGSYHGEEGFMCFTHKKSIVNKSTKIDMPVRYQPYTDKKYKMIKFFMH